MEDLIAAMGKLGGSGTCDTDDISDDELFKQPPPNEDCPICLLRLPTLPSGNVYKSCCGKIICGGCDYAPVYDNLGNEIIEEKCPFCRTPLPCSDEENNGRILKRVELDDAEAIFTIGCNYRNGEDGFPQDDVKSFELFVRAGELGCAEACNNVGSAYHNGNGNGNGAERDKTKAKYYYELSAMRGNVNARCSLGCLEAQVGNWERALKHYMIAAEGGGDQSVTNIRQLYTNGHATKDNYAKALQAYQKYLDGIKSKQRDKAAAASDEHKYYE